LNLLAKNWKDTKKFWDRFFGVKVGDKVKIQSRGALTPVRCSNSLIGKVIGKGKAPWGEYFEVLFLKKDNPKMVDHSDIMTFGEEYLEII